LRFLSVLVILLVTGMAWSQDEVSVDASFDKTGDGMVDATDWKEMTEAEKTAYATASIRELGEDPDAKLDDGSTRAQQFLRGLKSVYEK